MGFKALSEHSKQYINKQLKAFLSADFDRLLLPRRFRYVDHIPSNPQGKRIASELQELFK